MDYDFQIFFPDEIVPGGEEINEAENGPPPINLICVTQESVNDLHNHLQQLCGDVYSTTVGARAAQKTRCRFFVYLSIPAPLFDTDLYVQNLLALFADNRLGNVEYGYHSRLVFQPPPLQRQVMLEFIVNDCQCVGEIQVDAQDFRVEQSPKSDNFLIRFRKLNIELRVPVKESSLQMLRRLGEAKFNPIFKAIWRMDTSALEPTKVIIENPCKENFQGSAK